MRGNEGLLHDLIHDNNSAEITEEVPNHSIKLFCLYILNGIFLSLDSFSVKIIKLNMSPWALGTCD